MDPVLIIAQLLLYLISILGVAASDTMPENRDLYPAGFTALDGTIHHFANEPELLIPHLIKLGISILAMLFILFPFRPKFLIWAAKPIFFTCMALLVVILKVGLGSGGEHRFLPLPIIGQFQPSEVMKLASILYLANFFHNKPADQPIAKPLVWIFIASILIAAGGDKATGVFLMALAILILIFMGVPWRRLVATGALACIFIFSVASVFASKLRVPDRWDFWISYIKGDLSNADGTYQIKQSVKTILKSGVFGQGLGTPMEHRIPQAENDMIFASVVWAGGWLLGIMLLVGFFLIFSRGFNIASNLTGSSSILAIGVTVLLVLQAADNISGAIGALPISGSALPLISYGGTNMLISGVALGILHALSRDIQAQGVNELREQES